MKRSFQILIMIVGTIILTAPVSASAAARSAAVPASSHVPNMFCDGGTSGSVTVTATVSDGKFHGDKEWGKTYVPHSGYMYWIDVEGALTSYAGTTQLFVSYDYCGAEFEKYISKAVGNQTVNVPPPSTPQLASFTGGYSDVKLYVCNNYIGYYCGAAV